MHNDHRSNSDEMSSIPTSLFVKSINLSNNLQNQESFFSFTKTRYQSSEYHFKFIYLFILFILAALGLRCCVRASSSCGEQGLLFVAVCGLLIAVASLVVEHGLLTHGPQQLWLAGSRAQAQQLWHTGLAAPRHVGSSRTRAQTHVPCIGRQILNHCATREAHEYHFRFKLESRRGK